MRASLLIVLFSVLVSSSIQAQKFQLPDLAALEDSISFIQSIEDNEQRSTHLNQFWDSLKHYQMIPFTSGRDAVFMYRSNSNNVQWSGDHNGWSLSGEPEPVKIQGTDLWIGKSRFPPDARIDYKIVEGSNWILDPNNPLQQWSGFGPNSELRMPAYDFPEETKVRAEIPKGNLSDNIAIKSDFLGESINYKVYKPAGYGKGEIQDLPVIYVTDGHEYSDPKLGHMTIVLDNIIYDEKIPPVIAVFIDPRINGQNKRMELYIENPDFADFIVQELIPEIEENYKADTTSASRAIMGTSLGGLNSAYIALRYPEVFDNIVMHSPALNPGSGLAGQIKTDNLPPNFFISTGTIYDTKENADEFYDGLARYHYNAKYVLVNEGHSWGNWKALIDDPLIFFWGTDKNQVKNEWERELPETIDVFNYPNPFNPTTILEVRLDQASVAGIAIYDQLGRKVMDVIREKYLAQGAHHFSLDFSGFSSGVYYSVIKTADFKKTNKMLLMK